MVNNSFLRSVLKLPILTLIGSIIFIVFLLYSIAKGFIAAATEFGHEFAAVFWGFSGKLIIIAAVVLIVAGVVIRWRNGSLGPKRGTSQESESIPPTPSPVGPEEAVETEEQPAEEQENEESAETGEPEPAEKTEEPANPESEESNNEEKSQE